MTTIKTTMTLLALLLLAGHDRRAWADHQGDCLNPAGASLNDRLHYDGGIVWTPYSGQTPQSKAYLQYCNTLDAGTPWMPRVEWLVAEAFHADFSPPAGFDPCGGGPANDADCTPIDDFRAKWQAIDYVIDAGTSSEVAVCYGSLEGRTCEPLPETATLPLPAFLEDRFGGPALLWFSLPRLPPMSIPGRHTADVTVYMSDVHCDGLGPDVGECLPAGASTFSPWERAVFEVIAPN